GAGRLWGCKPSRRWSPPSFPAARPIQWCLPWSPPSPRYRSSASLPCARRSRFPTRPGRACFSKRVGYKGRLRLRLVVAAVVEAAIVKTVVVEVVPALIVLIIVSAAAVERAVTAPGAVVGRGRCAADVVDAGLAGKLAAAAAAPGGCSARPRGRVQRGGLGTVRGAHHGANAAQQHRAADHAGRRGGCVAEKRAAGWHRYCAGRARHGLRCLHGLRRLRSS